jgi:hypothetical protein
MQKKLSGVVGMIGALRIAQNSRKYCALGNGLVAVSCRVRFSCPNWPQFEAPATGLAIFSAEEGFERWIGVFHNAGKLLALAGIVKRKFELFFARFMSDDQRESG